LRAIEALLEQRERADGELVFQNRRGLAQDSSCVTDALKVALDRAALSRDMKNSPPSPPRGPLSRGYGLRATTGSEVYSKNAPGRLIELTELGLRHKLGSPLPSTSRPSVLLT
jgi:hypothetical protein